MQFRYRWIVASLGCAVLLWHGASHGAEGLSTFEPGFQACATPVSAQEEERLRSELRRYEGILAPLQRKLETLADPPPAPSGNHSKRTCVPRRSNCCA